MFDKVLPNSKNYQLPKSYSQFGQCDLVIEINKEKKAQTYVTEHQLMNTVAVCTKRKLFVGTDMRIPIPGTWKKCMICQTNRGHVSLISHNSEEIHKAQ